MAIFSDDAYKILIIGGSGSGKTNALLNLINNLPDIDKICLYAKDPFGAKHQYLINKRERARLGHFNDVKALIKCSNNMQDVYKNIEEYNLGKKSCKILILILILIIPVVTELFIRGRKLTISIVFITKSYFKVTKDFRLNSASFFIMKENFISEPQKRTLKGNLRELKFLRELQRVTSTNSIKSFIRY